MSDCTRPLACACLTGEDAATCEWSRAYQRRKAKAPPPQPADAVREDELQELWLDLVEKDDRTSPEEYPDHALITREEFIGYLRHFAEAERQSAAIEARAKALEEAAQICAELARLEAGQPFDRIGSASRVGLAAAKIRALLSEDKP